MVENIGQLGERLTEPLQTLLAGVLNTLPGLVGGIVVLIVGWLVAAVIARLVHRALEATKVEKFIMERTGLRKTAGAFDLVGFLSLVTKWFVFVPFLASAAQLVELEPLSTFLMVLYTWVPSAIGAVTLAFFGLVTADYLAAKVESTKMRNASWVASGAQWLVLILTALVVLENIGLNVGIVKDSFNIILAGVMLAFAIAVGIGFGNALKGDADKIVKNWKR